MFVIHGHPVLSYTGSEIDSGEETSSAVEGGKYRSGICQGNEARCRQDEWGSGRDVGVLDMCSAAGLSAALVGDEGE